MVQGSSVGALTERARWLAELSEALDDAQRLLAGLAGPAADNPLAFELHLRIEAARFAIQTFRLNRTTVFCDNSDPKWIESLPWKHRHVDSV